MLHKIDPTVDVVFKAILGTEQNKNLLVHFINAFMGYEGDERVRDVILKDPFNLKEDLEGKLSVVDVKATDLRGRQFQIDIQLGNHRALNERILFIWSALYQKMLQESEAYHKLNKVISIWLLVEDRLPFYQLDEERNWKRVRNDLIQVPFYAYSPEAKVYLTNHMDIQVFQLKNWKTGDKIEDERGRWLGLFKTGKNIDPDAPPDFLETPEMRQAMTVMRQFAEKEENFARYLSRLDARTLERTRDQIELELRLNLKQAYAAAEQAYATAEQERAAKEQERAAKEQERAAKEQERAARELERAERERFQSENQRYRQKLIDAGIDPDS